MEQWHVVEPDGPVGTEPMAVDVVGTTARVLLVRGDDGVLHATDAACPHLGQPLTLGTVEGAVIECRHHFHRYSLVDGRCQDSDHRLAGRLAVHEVRERGTRIEVRLAPSDDGDGRLSVRT